MSVSMYSNQVNRLTGELASLRSKLANERARLADANAKAIKAVEALSKAKTSAQLGAKGREVERYQKAAAGHEKKAADLERAIGQKQKNLTSAQSSLGRAQRDQQRKDDRDTDRRRKADLDHIRRLERERRATTALPRDVSARPREISSSTPTHPQGFTETYDVCLSFAGEQRDYVELIASELKKAGLAVFYDQDQDIAPTLWGRDLGEYLDYIYRQGSRFCLMFISKDYAEKAWTIHERRSALARLIQEGGDYLLPARFDDTELPGLRPTIAYVDLRQIAPRTLVEFVGRSSPTPPDREPASVTRVASTLWAVLVSTLAGQMTPSTTDCSRPRPASRCGAIRTGTDGGDRVLGAPGLLFRKGQPFEHGARSRSHDAGIAASRYDSLDVAEHLVDGVAAVAVGPHTRWLAATAASAALQRTQEPAGLAFLSGALEVICSS